MNTSYASTVTTHSAIRERRPAREQEILRVVADLAGLDLSQSVTAARNQVLKWAQNKAAGVLPPEAWEHQSFDRPAGGRSCSVVRLEAEHQDIWSLRIEDPDKNVAGRVWTTEINILKGPGAGAASFSLRLLASTSEARLEIEPHVPGVIRQIIDAPGLWSGNYKLVDRPLRVKDDEKTQILLRALLDPSRKIPIIALSVPEDAGDAGEPLFDAATLSRACAGLAIVVALTPSVSWALTERLGKQLSVYNGAARVYLPGFTEDANPFGGHELILPHGFENPEMATRALTRLRWIAANGSVRRLQLGTDLLAFSALKAQELQRRQTVLQDTGATVQEQFDAATARIDLLQHQLDEAINYQQQFSDLHQEAEQRAENAETQVRAAAFRIQQLLEQLESSGVRPDAQIGLPSDWGDFANWCDVNLAGRVVSSPQARRSIKDAQFDDVRMTARCSLWLANQYRTAKMSGGEGSFRDAQVESGVTNAHCGSDAYMIDWQGMRHEVAWHVKNGGNTRDPARCLRIYYFWDDSSQQVVIAYMPAHRKTDAS